MARIKILCFVLLFVGYASAKPRQKLSPPIIKNISEGNELVVNAQNNVTLLCEGEEKITWTYPANTIEERYWSTLEVQTSEADGKYYAKLTLVNASYLDVDYYYCHAEGAAKDDKERSAKVYLYVRDENHLSVIEDIEFISAKQNSSVILPCRPTSPDVTVTLNVINGKVSSAPPLNKHTGFKVKLSIIDTHYLCTFKRNGIIKDLIIVVIDLDEGGSDLNPKTKEDNRVDGLSVINTTTGTNNVHFGQKNIN